MNEGKTIIDFPMPDRPKYQVLLIAGKEPRPLPRSLLYEQPKWFFFRRRDDTV